MPKVPATPTAPASVTFISQIPVTPFKAENMTADPLKITRTFKFQAVCTLNWFT